MDAFSPTPAAAALQDAHRALRDGAEAEARQLSWLFRELGLRFGRPMSAQWCLRAATVLEILAGEER